MDSGYWAWDSATNDFLWVSGVWRVAPSGMRWIPGYWAPCAEGHQWVSGFWILADAETVDSTALTIEQVVDRVLELGRERSLWA